MKPRLHLRKGFLVLVAVLVPLLVAGVLLAGDGLFESGLRTYAPAALGQPVAFEDADLSALAGSATIEGLVIGPAAEPLIQAGHIGLAASPLNFIRSRFRIDEAALDDTTVHLVVDENGRFSFDPGPPPPETPPDPHEKPRQKPLPPAQERDIVQVIAEYWERLQQYKEYYERVRGAGDAGDEAERERGRHPGRASYLRSRRPPGSGFWIGEAGVENLRLETRDERTGQPIIPAVQSLTFKIESLGDAPAGFTDPALIRGAGEFAGGGALEFHLQLSRSEEANHLRFAARGLPVADWIHLVSNSLPWDLSRGRLDLSTDNLRFRPDALAGSVRVTLHGARLRAKAGAPDVLGVNAAEFTRILNQGLEQGPIELVLRLGGTPTEPSFSIQNATSPAELVANALKSEVQERLQQEGQKRLNELLGDDAPDLGGLFGGGDQEKPKERKSRGKAKNQQDPQQQGPPSPH